MTILKRACHDVESLLVDYLEGGLPESDRQVVDSHCAACPACAHERQLWSAVRKDMRPALSVDGAEAFLATVRQRIAACGDRKPRTAMALWRAVWQRGPRAQLALTMALLVCVAGGAVIVKQAARNRSAQTHKPVEPPAANVAATARKPGKPQDDPARNSQSQVFPWSYDLEPSQDK